MGWSCEACTFLNADDDASRCQICETLRSEAAALVGSFIIVDNNKKQPADNKNTRNLGATTKTSAGILALGSSSSSSSGGVVAAVARNTATNARNISNSNNCKRPPAEQKSTVQATLFGGLAPKSQKEKPKSKKAKVAVGPLPDAETSKQSTLSFAAKRPPASTALSSSESTSGSSSLVLWKKCASNDVPFSELKDRTRLAMKSIFGVAKLRLLQPKAVSCALKRKSQLVVMATGGGAYACVHPCVELYFR